MLNNKDLTRAANDSSVFTITEKAPTAHLANCLKNVINVKVLKGAFSVIVKTDGSFAALVICYFTFSQSFYGVSLL